MATKRLLELALQGLEAERQRINDEVTDIQKQLRAGGSPAHAQAKPQPQAAKAAPKKGRLTAAGRKALSDAMKRRWAAKKKALAK